MISSVEFCRGNRGTNGLDNEGADVIRVNSNIMIDFRFNEPDSSALILAKGSVVGVFVELGVLLEESSDDSVGED